VKEGARLDCVGKEKCWIGEVKSSHLGQQPAGSPCQRREAGCRSKEMGATEGWVTRSRKGRSMSRLC